jgi:hypothetical protein
MLGRTRLWRLAGCAAVAAVTALVTASPAIANGAGTVTFKQIIKDRVDSQADVNPCSGVPGTVTMHINNAVFHVTINSNGFWATETIEGTVSFTPDDPSQPSYSGHFTEWEGDNGNRQNGTATTTTNDHLKGSDGSMLTFHDVAHMSFSANGINSISFDKPRLTCP